MELQRSGLRQQRTYWHLESLRRKPTDYDVVTSNLLYYVERGFEVQPPVAEWYRKYQQGSPFQCRDWERFRDPRETTYTKYVDIQRNREVFVDGLLRSIEGGDYDRRLSAEWAGVLERVLAPWRYPAHGLQMVAAYVGQMAPSGRIVITSLLQGADEMRVVQRLAYRMRQLQLARPGFGAKSQQTWEQDPVWQPLREALERLLVTYDWGEGLVALNLVVKPAIDELLMTHFAQLAAGHGDHVLQKLLFSLNEDRAWHRDWTAALIRLALEDRPENGPVIRAWIGRWQPLAAGAVAAFAPVFDGRMNGAEGGARPFAGIRGQIEGFCRGYWTSLGLEMPS